MIFVQLHTQRIILGILKHTYLNVICVVFTSDGEGRERPTGTSAQRSALLGVVYSASPGSRRRLKRAHHHHYFSFSSP